MEVAGEYHCLQHGAWSIHCTSINRVFRWNDASGGFGTASTGDEGGDQKAPRSRVEDVKNRRTIARVALGVACGTYVVSDDQARYCGGYPLVSSKLESTDCVDR